MEEYQQHVSKTNTTPRRGLKVSIGTKIIVPYFLLTLIIAAVGTYVVTNLVATSLEERINNQLLDAGRIVSEGIVRYEELRLQTLRAIVNTPQLATGTADQDTVILSQFAPQLIINSNTDAVIFLDMEGLEIYSWTRVPAGGSNEGVERLGRSFAQFPAVQLTLANVDDDLGDNHVFVNDSPLGMMIYTTSPVMLGDTQVGAALVGTYTRRMLVDLNQNAIAQVTLYDQNGRVLDTTLRSEQTLDPQSGDQPDPTGNLYALLTESPARYEQVIQNAGAAVPIKSIAIDDQEYRLAYGDWRLRDRSFGMFSVALPSNFIVATITTSRSQFVAVFTIAVLVVIGVGYLISQRITVPIKRLVDTAVAVTGGDLQRRADIRTNDEIAELSSSFNQMTQSLAERNLLLAAQSEELEAILYSITDGVIVLNKQEEVIRFNPAAKRLIADLSHDFLSGPLRDVAQFESHPPHDPEDLPPTRRFQIGSRFLDATTAPLAGDDEQLGKVIILRDVTREVEAENLKSAFITSISHELRTPLTMVKVYADLLHQKESRDPNSTRRPFLRHILKGSQDLEHHINQLIRLSEIQAGTIQMTLQPVQLQPVVNDIVTRWKDLFAGKGKQLISEIDPEPLWVQADASHLSWAIDNLLRNALAYSADEDVVRLQLEKKGSKARLNIIDRGVGIAAADQPYIFDRFFRATSNINFDNRGVGLGLYISKAIIDMHDGEIRVQSELGEGSTFSIQLLLLPPESAAEKAAMTAAGTGA